MLSHPISDAGVTDSDGTVYHPRSKRRLYLHVCISEEDRAALARLTHARKLSGSEVVRLLIAEEDARTEGAK